jgi:hypothetical protein
MQYIACCRHLCILLAFCSSSKSGADNTVTSPRPLSQLQIHVIRLPIRMPAFDFKKYWIYVSTNQSFDRFGKQITLCESLSSFSQFLPEPDTGLLNPTSLRKPLNSACPTQHKPLKTPIRCLRTPHLHDTFDKAIREIHFRSPILYAQMQPRVNLAVADHRFDLEPGAPDLSPQGWLSYLLQEEAKLLGELSILGWQRYLVSPWQESFLTQEYAHLLRLGDLRGKGFDEVEVVLR